MIYGYARVSTKGQQLNGNSLEHQELLLKEAGCAEIIIEQFTGKTTDRPKFASLVQHLRTGDTLVVTKLDRFARSTIEGSQIVQRLLKQGTKVNILNMGMLDNTPASVLIRTIFFAFAEFERNMIIERTQEGKAVARTKAGFKEGRPKAFTQTQLDHAVLLLQNHSFKEVEQLTRISKSTLAREARRQRAAAI